jgi:hypothetical protein
MANSDRIPVFRLLHVFFILNYLLSVGVSAVDRISAAGTFAAAVAPAFADVLAAFVWSLESLLWLAFLLQLVPYCCWHPCSC